MGPEIILNGQNNIILAEGHSRGFWGSWKAIALGILLGLLILLGLFVFFLSRPLPLPEKTLFYAVATPDEVSRLSPEIRQALPQDWRTYLSLKSRWPLVFGLYREEEAIYSFVISPLWRVPTSEKIHQYKAGLTMLASDTDLAMRKDRSYWSFFRERWMARAPVVGIEPAEALGAVNGHESVWLRFTVKPEILRSNLSLAQAPNEPLSQADFSFRVPETEHGLQTFGSLPYLPPPETLSRLPDLMRGDLQFGDPGKAIWTTLTFKSPLDESQAGILLGAYGFTIRRPITLPDGSTSFERIEPVATSGTSLLGLRRDEMGRSANISNYLFTLATTSSIPEIGQASACSSHGAWMRLSAKTVATLARRFGLELNSEQVRPLQVVSDKGKLAVCFE